ncbi:MAG: hypothetical protein MJ245_02765, partial [Clostridia bacterium]|nr:hypothetical protein [Clostridia bacterium]
QNIFGEIKNMNTRNLTNAMLIILGLLIVAIILSFVYNDKEKVNDDIYEEQTIGDAVNPDEIVINDFSNLFHYFGTFENGVKAREVLQSELSRYGTTVKNFMTQNDVLENDTLTFSIMSLENDEEYKVTVTTNEMTLTRIK